MIKALFLLTSSALAIPTPEPVQDPLDRYVTPTQPEHSHNHSILRQEVSLVNLVSFWNTRGLPATRCNSGGSGFAKCLAKAAQKLSDELPMKTRPQEGWFFGQELKPAQRQEPEYLPPMMVVACMQDPAIERLQDPQRGQAITECVKQSYHQLAHLFRFTDNPKPIYSDNCLVAHRIAKDTIELSHPKIKECVEKELVKEKVGPQKSPIMANGREKTPTPTPTPGLKFSMDAEYVAAIAGLFEHFTSTCAAFAATSDRDQETIFQNCMILGMQMTASGYTEQGAPHFPLQTLIMKRAEFLHPNEPFETRTYSPTPMIHNLCDTDVKCVKNTILFFAHEVWPVNIDDQQEFNINCLVQVGKFQGEQGHKVTKLKEDFRLCVDSLH